MKNERVDLTAHQYNKAFLPAGLIHSVETGKVLACIVIDLVTQEKQSLSIPDSAS